MRATRIVRSLAVAMIPLMTVAAGLTPAAAGAAPVAQLATPGLYALEFVSTAATGIAMNDAGDVVGTSYPDPGCGSSCLPELETVVWRDGARIVLAGPPDRPVIQVQGMNASGWVIGSAAPSYPGFEDHAVVWKPVGSTYQAIDLGVLPGTTKSYGVGIDDSNRAVGYSTTQFFPPTTKSFLWTEAGGLVDLTVAGFPDIPVAVSPGGTVATFNHWYVLGDPGSVTELAAAPQGFGGVQTWPAAINDAGDQARFLWSTGPQNLRYLFRYHHEGQWQQISSTGTGHLSTYGVGSITEAKDITATVAGAGVIAPGPNGMAQALTPLVSSAYPGADVTMGGPMNDNGEVLAKVLVGRSSRLVRLTPTAPCGVGCIRVASLKMTGEFIPDPQEPDQCTPDASNHVTAKATVTDETGKKLKGVQVTGRFLDDYWLDHEVTGRTNARGIVQFVHDGPACVGAVAFLIDAATKTAKVLDRTTGVLTNYVIPLP